MKILYYIRVFFVSYEFLFLFSGLAIYLFFGDLLSGYFAVSLLNEDAVKWAMLFPMGMTGWTLKEGVGVIFPDGRDSKVLHEWPEYWRLKVHFNVGIFNSILFILPCAAIWFAGAPKSFRGAWIFSVFAIALSINAFGFYAAKISIKSALIRHNEDANSS
jgi:hypothetical protein